MAQDSMTSFSREPSLSPAQSHQLIGHYQKLRAELHTVKTAYLAAQEKVAGVESVVKQKEVVLRSSVEENDMLTFNNQRLTKRVEQLMIQLQEAKAKASSSWGGFFSGANVEIARLNEALEVSKEQLGRTLVENESLVSQMHQLREGNQGSIEALENKLNNVKVAAKQEAETMLQLKNQSDMSLMELTDEKNACVAKLSAMDRELEATRALMAEKEQTMTSINRQLSSDLEHTQHLFDHKVAFDDTRAAEYNRQNCPGFDRVLMVRKIEIAEEALGLLENLASTFRSFDAALRERYILMGRNLSAMSKLQRVNEKICSLLPERLGHLEALHRACAQAVLQMKSVLDLNLQPQCAREVTPKTVAKLFQRVILYYDKLLPYELLSLVEEARKDTTVPVLQARNYVLISTHKRFVAALDKLSTYIQLAFRGRKQSRVQEANEPAILKHAYASMSSVHKEFQAFASHLISKISQEHRAPFVLPELKAVNEKMLNSLSTLVALTGKMTELLNDYLGVSSTHTMCTIRGVECDPMQMSEDLPSMQARARNFFGRLRSQEPPIRLRIDGNAIRQGDLQSSSVDGAMEKLFRQQLAEKNQQLRTAGEELAVTKSKLDAMTDSETRLQSEVDRLTAALKKQEAEMEEAALSARESKPQTSREGSHSEGVDEAATRTNNTAEVEIGILRGEMVLKDKEIAALVATLEECRAKQEREARPKTPPSNSGAPQGEGETVAEEPGALVDVDVLDALRAERDAIFVASKEEAAKYEAEIARLKEENARLLREQSFAGKFEAGSRMQELDQRLWHTTQPARSDSPAYSITITDHDGNEVEPVLLSDEDWHREQQIKRYYESRAAQMHKRLQLADKIAMR